MALDANLFTLDFVRRPDSQNIVDIIDHSRPSNGPLYTRHRALHSPVYDMLLLDGLTDVPLGSVNVPSTIFASSSGSKEREKLLRLHNPDGTVIISKQGNTFHQDFAFEWEGEQFRWRKDSGVAGGTAWDLAVIRKPDPAVSAAIYRPSTKGRPALMQIFDYNLNRFDINDKRGLEVLILLSLSLLLDMDYDENHKSDNMYISADAVVGSGSKLGSLKRNSSKIGRSDVAEGSQDSSRQLLQSSQPNEVPINTHGEVKEYVDHCISLLRNDASHEGLSLIVLRAESQGTTAKAVKVAGEIKAAYYKLPQTAKGSADAAEDLYMYVQDGERPSKSEASATSSTSAATSPGPRPRINLNAPASPPATSRSPSPSRPQYTPPSSLSIYLSKERLDEFEAAQHRLPKSLVGVSKGPPPAGSSHMPPQKAPAASPPIPPHPAQRPPPPLGAAGSPAPDASASAPVAAGKKLFHRLAGFKRSEGSTEA